MSQGWAALGKPDFATCGKLFYRLPADLREGLNRSEEKVLIWTLFLTWVKSFRSGRGSDIASFSEMWLGAKFGRSRWTAMRALVRLEKLSLLKRIRRSPKKDGTFQTNLIALTGRLTSIFGTKTAQPREKTPCSKNAPQGTKSEYKGEKTASSRGFASHSLSLSSFLDSRENDWKREVAEGTVEKGTLTRLFEQFRTPQPTP